MLEEDNLTGADHLPGKAGSKSEHHLSLRVHIYTIGVCINRQGFGLQWHINRSWTPHDRLTVCFCIACKERRERERERESERGR